MVQTIKTAIVVVLLLAVCYGAFVALNAPEPDLPDSISDWMTEDENIDELVVGIDMGESTTSLDPNELLNELESSQATPPQVGTSEDTTQLSPDAMPGDSTDPLPSFPPVAGASGQNNGMAGTAATTKAQEADSNSIPGLPEISGLPTDGDLNGFPATQGLSPNSNSVNTQLVGEQTEIPTDASSQANGLVPPMLDAPKAEGSNATNSSLAADNGQTTRDAAESRQPANGSTEAAADVAQQSTQIDPPAESQVPTVEFATARTQALELAEAGELKSALELLSPYVDSPELGYEQRSDLLDILDALCREVVYSKKHLLLPAYVVDPQDTVASVAEKHQITPELLNAINGLGDSKALLPNSQLKVLQGPFRAVVSLSRSELTLFLGDLYAGRFPFSTGQDPAPEVGSYRVVDKRQDRTYYTPGAAVLTADDPRNPYGGYWLDLGDNLCIHGTSVMPSRELENAGCISLAPRDAQDVYNILITDSRVEIRK